MTTITSIFLAFCFAIPSIGTESPLKECNGYVYQKQAIIDTEELALYCRYGKGHEIGDHVGSVIGDAVWDMSLVSVGDIGILYTESGAEYYECIAIMKVRNTGRAYLHRGKAVTVDRHDIICLSCVDGEDGWEVCAYFDYKWSEDTA